MRSTRRYASSGIAVGMVLLMTACGGADSSGDDPGGSAAEESPLLLTGDDRTATLEECAADEGGLTWYTSLAGSIVDGMVAGFNEEYPDITVEVFRGEQTDVVSRVVQESQAGRLQGDVVEVTSDGFRVLDDLGVLQPFTTPTIDDYSERFTIPASEGEGVLGVGDRASYVGFAYNTDAVPEEEVPQDMEDLLDPALQGKLAITSSTTGVRFVGNVYERFGEEEGEAFLQQLAEQNVRVEAISGSALAELIARGEVAASPGIFRNHAQQLREEGQPIEWLPLEPVTANVGYAGAFADSENPCSAALFLEFQLGDQGTQIYEGLQYPRPSEDLGFESWVPDETFESTDAYTEAFEMWSAKFDEYFG